MPRSKDTGEKAQEERLKDATEFFLRLHDTENKISIRKAAARHGVPWESVRDRVKGAVSRKKAMENRQLLTLFEESVVESYCNTLHGWGWPARIHQIRRMATEILKNKGDARDLGANWHLAFLQRHPDLKSKISSPRSMDRITAQDRNIFVRWFDLFLGQKEKYRVHDDDVYNMDEKGVALGVAGKLRVIIPKREKNPHTSGGSGSREWVTATEACSLTGRILPSWTIFKGVKNQDKWHKTMKQIGLANSGYHICTSENGWTNNELGQAYLEDHFNRHTKAIAKGEYRILIVDGHDSHLTTKVIQYCIDNKIILLCLPPHTTHMLQPLDVGCFGPLSQVYKGMISDAYTFGSSYNIEKCEFLEIWHAAREKSLTVKNIRSSWQKCGILQTELGRGALDREVVLSQLPPGESGGPLSRPSTAGGPVDPCSLNETPRNIAEIQAVIRWAQKGELDETDILLALEKLGKAATNTMAEIAVTRSVNQDLVDAAKKKKKTQQNREAGTDGSCARVMGQEEVLRRAEFGKDKKFEAVWKEFSHAGFAVVFSCNITAKDKGIKLRSLTKPATKSSSKSSAKSPRSPKKSQLPLPSFTDLISSPPSNSPTRNSDDPTRKSPKRTVKNAAKSRVSMAKVAKTAMTASSTQRNQVPVEDEAQAPIITRSGRIVKRKIWE